MFLKKLGLFTIACLGMYSCKDNTPLETVSMEDRIVKDFFNRNSGKTSNISRYLPPIEPNNIVKSLKVITKKVIKPMKDEIKLNYYSRSAKLRIAKKI